MKNPFDLQLFAEAVSGKKIVYLYRPYSARTSQAGLALAFTTENSRTKSKDADSTETKDGPIRTPGASEVEISATSILAKGDDMISDLEEAMDNDELIEIWEANLEDPGTTTNTFKGHYYQGYLTEIEIASNAEDYVEVSLTFGINGVGVAGNVTVSADQQEVANYVFADTTQVTSSGGNGSGGNGGS